MTAIPSTLYAIEMNLLKLFKKKEQSNPKLPSTVFEAEATLYSDKILIVTVDKVKEGFGLSSTKLTILPTDAASELIGFTLRKQLALTEHGLSIPKDYKQHYSGFLSAAGFKNAKEHHKDALHLMIGQKDGIISITPTHNGGATGKERGFIVTKEMTDVKVSNDVSNTELGEQVKAAWKLCTKSV